MTLSTIHYPLLTTMNIKYNDTHKEEAFKIYRQVGKLNIVAEEMRKKYPKLKFDHSTIKRWANEKDPLGRTWKERKDEIKTIAIKKNDMTLADFKNEYINELLELKQQFYSDITDLKPSTKEGAFYAIDKINQRLMAQLGFDPKNEGNKLKLEQALFIWNGVITILKRHPIIGPVVNQYYIELENEFKTFSKEIEKMIRKE